MIPSVVQRQFRKMLKRKGERREDPCKKKALSHDNQEGACTFSEIYICIGYILRKIISYLFQQTFIFHFMVSNWLRCQIGAGVKLTPLHSWCQIDSGVKLTPVSNCPPTFIYAVQYSIKVEIWEATEFQKSFYMEKYIKLQITDPSIPQSLYGVFSRSCDHDTYLPEMKCIYIQMSNNR